MTNMIDEMRSALAELSLQLDRRKTIDSMLVNLQMEEKALTLHEKDSKAVLTKEEKDVARLEKTTVTSVFYSFLGQEGARLNREKQEEYAARLEYDAAARQLDDLRKRMDQLRMELGKLADCEDQYERVISKLREALREDPEYAGKLSVLDRQHGEAVGQLQRLEEAISAGEKVMLQIGSINAIMPADVEVGYHHVHISSLNMAQAGAEKLQLLLQQFHKELKDVRIGTRLKEMIGDFQNFTDFFLDGWPYNSYSIVQDCLDKLHEVQRIVDHVMTELNSLRASRFAQKSDLEKQINDLIIGS